MPPGPAPTPNQANGEEADPKDGAFGRREVNAGGGSAIVNPDETHHAEDRVASDEILTPVDTAAAVFPPEAPGEPKAPRKLRLLILLLLLGGFLAALLVPGFRALLAQQVVNSRDYFRLWAAENPKFREYTLFRYLSITWVGRIGKILEFTSALAIILDLIQETAAKRWEEYTRMAGTFLPFILKVLNYPALIADWIGHVLKKFTYKNFARKGKVTSVYLLILGFLMDLGTS
jgi:hypothetical protein